MEVAVAMIWFAFCCVYMVLFSAVVASKENFTGYDVNLTAITNRNLSHDESLDNSAFALPQTTDVDSFTSNSSYKATEVPNRQLFNIEVLQPVSGHLLTPTIDVGNVCSCDELEDLCDINCCCDKECSQELALFTGCTMLTLSGNNQFCSHATASYALQYTVEGYSQLQSFVQQEMYHDSFCIQSHNPFLVDRQSRCSRRVDLKEDCSSRPSISIDTYTNINLYAGRNGGATVVPVEMASLVLQSLDGTQNEVIINEEENMQPSLINQKVCINVVLKVAYFVKYNKAGQIVNTTVHLLLGNFHITPFSLEQEFSVKFIQEIKNAPFQNSGNPGHIVGLPILSGQEIAEYPLFTNGMVLNVNPEDTLSLLQSSANHDCMNSVHNRSPVLFGVDSISGCTLRLEDVANCSLVSHIILDVLRGQTSRQYVATFGNSELQNPLDWVPIKHNYNDRDSQICSIPLSLHLQIEWTKYGFLWNPQTQIVSVEEIIQTNATILASFIRGSDALSIQSLVSFKEISAAALSGYRATPTINAKLPIDFFFPFV
ncbi:tectonic-1 isoform X15 [Syngnathus typhle]|uniref:tectonic-1 isoform X15 n=1 Tax=Syngnathus typhle TaxID=161592 RepID=UPI002A69A979|nr:tectonic-1 isoform X15 [Syngnathus typhle]